MFVPVISSTGSFVFIVKFLPDEEFSASGCFVGFTIGNGPVSAIIAEKVVSSLGHPVDDGAFLRKFEAGKDGGSDGKVVADADS